MRLNYTLKRKGHEHPNLNKQRSTLRLIKKPYQPHLQTDTQNPVSSYASLAPNLVQDSAPLALLMPQPAIWGPGSYPQPVCPDTRCPLSFQTRSSLPQLTLPAPALSFGHPTPATRDCYSCRPGHTAGLLLHSRCWLSQLPPPPCVLGPAFSPFHGCCPSPRPASHPPLPCFLPQPLVPSNLSHSSRMHHVCVRLPHLELSSYRAETFCLFFSLTSLPASTRVSETWKAFCSWKCYLIKDFNIKYPHT